MQATIERMNGPTEARFGKKYGFMMNGQWHDFFTKFPLAEGVGVGAVIEVDVEANGTYAPKVKRLKVVTPAAPGAIAAHSSSVGHAPVSDRELQIMRQNAMTNANAFLHNNACLSDAPKLYTLEELLETATVLTSFYTGEITYEDLKAEVEPNVVALAKSMK